MLETCGFQRAWKQVQIKACLCLPESQIPFREVSLQYIKEPTLEKHSQAGCQCWVLSNEVSFVKTNHVFINNSKQVDITSLKWRNEAKYSCQESWKQSLLRTHKRFVKQMAGSSSHAVLFHFGQANAQGAGSPYTADNWCCCCCCCLGGASSRRAWTVTATWLKPFSSKMWRGKHNCS